VTYSTMSMAAEHQQIGVLSRLAENVGGASFNGLGRDGDGEATGDRSDLIIQHAFGAFSDIAIPSGVGELGRVPAPRRDGLHHATAGRHLVYGPLERAAAAVGTIDSNDDAVITHRAHPLLFRIRLQLTATESFRTGPKVPTLTRTRFGTSADAGGTFGPPMKPGQR
jgi:hypothetical protein